MAGATKTNILSRAKFQVSGVGVAVGLRHAVAVDVDVHVDTDGDVAADLCEIMPGHISYDS